MMTQITSWADAAKRVKIGGRIAGRETGNHWYADITRVQWLPDRVRIHYKEWTMLVNGEPQTSFRSVGYQDLPLDSVPRVGRGRIFVSDMYVGNFQIETKLTWWEWLTGK